MKLDIDTRVLRESLCISPSVGLASLFRYPDWIHGTEKTAIEKHIRVCEYCREAFKIVSWMRHGAATWGVQVLLPSVAKTAIEHRDPFIAAGLFREILTVDPDNADALYNLGVLENESGNIELAGNLWEKCLSQSPRHFQALSNLAFVYRKQKRAPEASELLERALEIIPDEPNTLWGLGLCSMDSGDLERAISCLQRLLDLHGNRPEVRKELAIAYIRYAEQLSVTGHEAAGRDAYVSGLQLAESIGRDLLNNAAFQYNLGCYFAAQHASEEAIKHWKSALDADPSHLGALNNLALSHGETGDERNARDLINRAIARYPQEAKLRNTKGLILEYAGRPREAFEAYTECLTQDSEFPPALYNVGRYWLAQSEPEKAISYFERVLTLAPQSLQPHLGLGAAYLAMGRYETAQACLAQANRLDDNHPTVLNYLGVCHLQLGDFKAATECFRRAVAAAPDLAGARFNLACAYHAGGQFDLAMRQYEDMLRQWPDRPDVHNNFGLALQALGRHAEALAQFEVAERLGPLEGGVVSNIGISRWKMGDYDGACAAFEKAVGLAPSNQEIRANLHHAKATLQKSHERNAVLEFHLVASALDLQPLAAQAA